MALLIVFLFSFNLTFMKKKGRQTNYQSTAPKDGNVFRVIQRHIGEGNVITLTDSPDLETSFVVGFIPTRKS
jgi:hypothetical protein